MRYAKVIIAAPACAIFLALFAARSTPAAVSAPPTSGATAGLTAWLPPQSGPIVRTRSGTIEGVRKNNLSTFKGIPYAAPPVGDLRWREPQPAAAWRGVRKADAFGNACIQEPGLSLKNGGDPGPLSEDCLYLNVWTPAPNASARLPVMVWIHGGALIFGSGSVAPYDGSYLAQRGAVVVTLNYRLAQLGFFSHPALDKATPGGPVNYGLLDLIVALKWVQQNVAAFGGNPGNVTIFGQSAGGQSVLALFASPLVKGLFQKGVAQSPFGIPSSTRAKAREAGVKVADALGLKGAAATLAELHAVPAEKFQQLKGKDLSLAPGFVIGDAALPKPILEVFQNSSEARLPLIIGSTSDDASVVETAGIDPAAVIKRLGGARILVKRLYPNVKDDNQLGREVLRDLLFTTFVRRIADVHARKAPSWRYYFSYVPVGLRANSPSVAHGNEIPFVMGTGGISETFTGADREMSRRVGDYWFEFARTGKPAPKGEPAWPQYHGNNDKTMEFGETIAVQTSFMRTRMRVFTGLLNVVGKFLGPDYSRG
ncbi:MAG: carboxylesterase/lipase family protein [Gemmatimonadaceae bacterium]|nr:carboxylesterase/lipase family protein [Gemmatimonadaceae bacterium]